MEETTMIRRSLTSFISIAGIGATILTILVLTAPISSVNSDSIAFGDQHIQRSDGELLDEGFRFDRRREPSCGEAYRKECDTYYRLNRWNHDFVRYGGTTITLQHKVAYDHSRNQYRYDYKIEYNGSKNVLMRWDVLDRMRSSSPNSSCILDLRNCHPHTFTMWCDEAPVMRRGKVQLYNNRPNTDDWNYWQCNQTSEVSGPVPASYPDQWWPRQRIRCNECKILKS